MFEFLGVTGDRGSLSERIQQSDIEALDTNAPARELASDGVREAVDLTPLRDSSGSWIRLPNQGPRHPARRS